MRIANREREMELEGMEGFGSERGVWKWVLWRERQSGFFVLFECATVWEDGVRFVQSRDWVG